MGQTAKFIGLAFLLLVGAAFLLTQPDEPPCDERQRQVKILMDEGLTLARSGDMPGALGKQASAETLMEEAPVCFDGWR